MKEQTDSHSYPLCTNSQEGRPPMHNQHQHAKAAKTRPIHKDKLQEPQPDREKNRASKEDRAKVQKEKNKEAAQRSRDIHKEYVCSLELEVNHLREELTHARRYCHHCRQQMDSEETHLLPQSDLLMEPSIQGNTDIEDMPGQKQQLSINQSPLEYSEPDSFLRILEPQQENSILKLMLFVCMIIIAVMVGFNKEPIPTEPRRLMQVYADSAEKSLKKDAVELGSVAKWGGDSQGNGLVQLGRGIEDPVCLDSLMKVESPVIKKSLTTIHGSSYKDEMDSIMLCSLRLPKSYQISPQLSDSPLVRLFVLGSQIKDLVSRSGSWMSLLDRNIQLNGIYRLSAEIKTVELVLHHNCLV